MAGVAVGVVVLDAVDDVRVPSSVGTLGHWGTTGMVPVAALWAQMGTAMLVLTVYVADGTAMLVKGGEDGMTVLVKVGLNGVAFGIEHRCAIGQEWVSVLVEAWP